MIICHLGNGSSITAIKNGIAIDTSMGFTPLAGLIMGTRSGTIDPSIVTFLGKKENLTFNEINCILNKKSGFLGISGVCHDVRKITDAANKNHEPAILANKIFEYQIIQYIGAYMASLGGCEAIVFTGGIGENNVQLRLNVCKNFSFMGIKIVEKVNETIFDGKTGKISDLSSKIDVLVIPTNEEIEILREIVTFLQK
jgi:acetate kinase